MPNGFAFVQSAGYMRRSVTGFAIFYTQSEGHSKRVAQHEGAITSRKVHELSRRPRSPFGFVYKCFLQYVGCAAPLSCCLLPWTR